MNLKTLLLTAWIGVLVLYFCIPAQAQWSINGDSTHWKANVGTNNGANVAIIATFGSIEMALSQVDPAQGGTVSATYSWYVTWSGGPMPPKQFVICDLQAGGSVGSRGPTNTATGSSDLNGDGGSLSLNYPPNITSPTYHYTLTETSSTKLSETVALAFSSVFVGDVNGKVNFHF